MSDLHIATEGEALDMICYRHYRAIASTIAQVLAYAEVIGGNTFFNFGNGNTLTVTGLTDIAALQNDIWIV